LVRQASQGIHRGGSVQLTHHGAIVRTHAIRHDPTREHGAYATHMAVPASRDMVHRTGPV
jgi:hypothetical protein